ncbi:sensor histidine kinase [Nocardioides sp. zg-1308]|uniref:sensor histidine kinase n=1 Tax=Nocardioides sp. zg-1308 TaxID=2736253 RepID=UPI0015541D0D|nr:sensor histidine kinase [Nocardioides sp. zg-1308]NPD04512.1 sensor histidine kinase [Nocardioides sp. zg-1308]
MRTLGAELISNERVALIELVKNAFDADASICLIRFEGSLARDSGSVTVLDDGHGMDAQTLSRAWLELATTTKRTDRRSESGRRRVLGEKGVGRLAAARIAHSLLVTTRRQDDSELELLVEWRDFDRLDAFLDEIDIAWASGDPDEFADGGAAARIFADAGIEGYASGHGTSLRMDGLTTDWDLEDLRELRRALERLAPPAPLSEAAGAATPEFRIFLELPSPFEDLSGEVGPPEALRDPLYQLNGEVDATGRATLRYFQAHPPSSEDIDLNLWANPERPPSCGPFKIAVRIWDRDRAGIAMAAPDMGVRDFRRLLDPLAGVSVYRDGFRVFPFGERGDDWLRLDARRVNNPSLRVSNNQIMGSVYISADENPGLQDQSNREGMQEGPAYDDFRTLIIAALTEVEGRRRDARKDGSLKPDVGNRLFDVFELSDVVDGARAGGASRHVIELIEARQREMSSGVDRVKEVISAFQLQATLGQLVDRVVHDGRNAIGPLRNKADLLKSAVGSGVESRIANRRSELLEVVETQTDVLRALFDGLDPLSGRKRGRPRKVSALSTVQKSIVGADTSLSPATVIDVGGDDVEVTWAESDIIMAVVNLVNNALYWVERTAVGEKRVSVRVRSQQEGVVIIEVSDSGTGVPEAFRASIFEAYFSMKPDGTGLGLAIVGSVAAQYDGELTYSPAGPLSGGTFSLVIRKRV